MDDAASFVARLRDVMARRDMTQKELADRLGLRQATVSAWFNQGIVPAAGTLIQLPELLREDGHWLLTGEREGAGSHVRLDPARAEPLQGEARARLEALLEEALDVVRAAAPEPSYVRVRAATAGELRALDAIRTHRQKGRIRFRKLRKER